MSEESPIGEVIQLSAGNSRAEITTVGAHLRRFDVDDHEVIVPFGDDLPWGSHGAVLAPWPNRLEDGRYEWDGHVHDLPITETTNNTAIHGLVRGASWQAESDGSTARLRTRLQPQEGYPFELEMGIAYALSDGALDVTFTAANVGSAAAPFGVGFHPWLAAGSGGVEAATLHVGVEGWFATNERLLPTGEHPIPADFDFRTPRRVGTLKLDDAFGRPHVDAEGRSWVHLGRGDGYRTGVWMSNPLAIWQLCTYPGRSPREGIAVEPMSCPANAFNTGTLLHRLEPGEDYRARWGITFSEG